MKAMPVRHTIHRCIWISLKFSEFSHDQVWPRSLSLSLSCFPSDFQDGASVSLGAGEEKPETQKHARLWMFVCNDLPSWKLHKWDMSKITWCLSEDRRLCVCSLSTVCPEDRWSLTVLFALPGQGGSFPSITLYKTQHVKAPLLL